MKIPCEECLVLPACKQRFIEGEGAVRFAVGSKCGRVMRYLVNDDLVTELDYTKRVNKLRKFYGARKPVGIATGYYRVRMILHSMDLGD